MAHFMKYLTGLLATPAGFISQLDPIPDDPSPLPQLQTKSVGFPTVRKQACPAGQRLTAHPASKIKCNTSMLKTNQVFNVLKKLSTFPWSKNSTVGFICYWWNTILLFSSLNLGLHILY